MIDFLQLLSNFWAMLGSVAPEAVVKALFVLVSVFGLRLVKVIPSSKFARAANVVLAVLLSGVTTGTATQPETAIMVMAAGFASAAWHLIDLLVVAQFKRKAFV